MGYFYFGNSFRSFIDEKTGAVVEGYSCFFGKDGKNINGIQPIKSQFFSTARFKELNIASLTPCSSVDLFFNEYGKVAVVNPL